MCFPVSPLDTDTAAGAARGVVLQQQQQHSEVYSRDASSIEAVVEIAVEKPPSTRRRHLEEFERFVDLFSQQDVQRSLLPFRVYRLETSAAICVCWGLLLVALGICLLIFALQAQEVVLDYTNSSRTTGSIAFQVKSRFQGPLYIYYRIEGFYANYRPYVKDGPPQVSSSYKCDAVKSQAQALALREVAGVQTLPQLLRNDVTGASILPSAPEIFPCGAQSVSLFTDDIFLFKQKSQNWPEGIALDRESVAYKWDFLQYMVRNSSWADQNLQPWILPSDTKFRVWLHPPFTPNFQKLYAISPETLEPGVQYYAMMPFAKWPAEAWGAKKAFVIASVTPMGGPNLPLALFALITGFLCILLILFVWLLKKRKFVFISSTVLDIDFNADGTLVEDCSGGEAAAAAAEGLSAGNVGKRNAGAKEESYATRMARLTPILPRPSACLCPFHCVQQPQEGAGQPAARTASAVLSAAPAASADFPAAPAADSPAAGACTPAATAEAGFSAAGAFTPTAAASRIPSQNLAALREDSESADDQRQVVCEWERGSENKDTRICTRARRHRHRPYRTSRELLESGTGERLWQSLCHFDSGYNES